jgi:hypothetical protein
LMTTKYPVNGATTSNTILITSWDFNSQHFFIFLI